MIARSGSVITDVIQIEVSHARFMLERVRQAVSGVLPANPVIVRIET